MSEDELAVELKWHMKSLGAEDNFLLLCAGPHNRAVQPSTGRKLQKGDIILAEITPSYRGQLAQICRTVVVGEPSASLRDKYALVVHAMDQGIAAARPGVPMAEVCRAINTVLEAQGYGEYCHPPHIRRRGHGLGFASVRPGDVALDNDTLLEPGMVFMIHPNQYLPETGYLLCGEPVLLTHARRRAADRAEGRAGDGGGHRSRAHAASHPADRPVRLGRRAACRRRSSSAASRRCGMRSRKRTHAIVFGSAAITPSLPISPISCPSSSPASRCSRATARTSSCSAAGRTCSARCSR